MFPELGNDRFGNEIQDSNVGNEIQLERQFVDFTYAKIMKSLKSSKQNVEENDQEDSENDEIGEKFPHKTDSGHNYSAPGDQATKKKGPFSMEKTQMDIE